MKIIVVSITKVEDDILESFIRHTCTFADEILMANNDGVGETDRILSALAAEGLPLTVYPYHTIGFEHADIINDMVGKAVSHDADFILPLDVDEFLVNTETKESVRECLARLSDELVYTLRWRKYEPLDADYSGEEFLLDLPARREKNWRRDGKVCFGRRAVTADFYLPQGAHYAYRDTGEGRFPVSSHRLDSLHIAHYHFRSAQRFALKTVIGGLSTVARYTQNSMSQAYMIEQYQRLQRGEKIAALDVLDDEAEQFSLAGYCGKQPIRYTSGQNVSLLPVVMQEAMRLAEAYAEERVRGRYKIAVFVEITKAAGTADWQRTLASLRSLPPDETAVYLCNFSGEKLAGEISPGWKYWTGSDNILSNLKKDCQEDYAVWLRLGETADLASLRKNLATMVLQELPYSVLVAFGRQKAPKARFSSYRLKHVDCLAELLPHTLCHTLLAVPLLQQTDFFRGVWGKSSADYWQRLAVAGREQLLGIVGEKEEQTVRKTSIIILSYNTLAMLQVCINSIRQYTKPDSYEIVVVDNASHDGSVDWLKTQSDIRCIFNQENAGFPKGCNQGMRLADPQNDILLLNSDTIVTAHWLDNMQTALYAEKKTGIAGCVTNYCSNRQSIVPSLKYQDIHGLQQFAASYNKSNPAMWEKRTTLVGFCYLIKRETVDAVGELDERFTPGNYEDDDYSLRALLAGYDLILCRDTYIHHVGSGSFARDADAKKQQQKIEAFNQLLARNEKLFARKWKLSDRYLAVYKSMNPDYLRNYLLYPEKRGRIDGKNLDPHKICFITAVNDEEQYNEALASWQQLIVPEGMTLESLVVQKAESMTSAYQEAMEASDAKYKIYLHQDLWIQNVHFLEKLIASFRQNPNCGIIGVVGTSKVPPSGIWWDGPLRGAIQDNHDSIDGMKSFLYERKKDRLLLVEAVDGCIMATQYDIPWRTDLFKKWHFYDTSQCKEFARYYYDVAVLPQDETPDCQHFCGVSTLDGYKEAQNIFLQEYKI